MTTSVMIRELCEKRNISLAEFCRRIGQPPQNINKKVEVRDSLFEEMTMAADALNVRYEQTFFIADGEKIELG